MPCPGKLRSYTSIAAFAVVFAASALPGQQPPRIDYTPAPEWPTAWRDAARRSVPAGARTLVLGESAVVVPRGARVGTQVDRVIRDIHWAPSEFDQRVPADRPPPDVDHVVPYMEGARVRELMGHAAVSVVPLGPARLRVTGSGADVTGLAGDGEGRYRFVVDPSKMEYATARRLADGILELPDTHGFNAIAESALRERPFLAIACMDMPSKAQAALWVARHGIAAYTATDRFAYELLGYGLAHPGAAPILTGAPIRGEGDHAIIGRQPISIALDEPVVAQWTDRQRYPWQYADAPWRYFAALSDLYAVPLALHKVTADAGEADRVVQRARELGARVVAVRVGKSNDETETARDAAAVAAWLAESPRHRAVLFHSAAYAAGYELLSRFPAQTTFGDLMPRFE